MKYDIKKDDIRFYHVGTNDRCTYLESITAQVKKGGSWMYDYEREDLRKRLSTMTEEQAKIELFKIYNNADDRLETWRMYQ